MKHLAIRKIDLRNSKWLILIFFILYLIINLCFLVDFPFIHSDESWLSGFTRHVIETGSFKVSEPFFIEYPRAVHGLRIIFVGLQSLFISLIGYTPFAVRLLSLVASLVTLWFVNLILKFFKWPSLYRVLSLLLISLQIQFIYASHLARQDALILLMMTVTFYTTLKKKNPILTGALIGISVGIHPNSFLIACGIGIIYFVNVLKEESSIKELLLLVMTTALWAALFIGISFSLNPNFVQDYLSFGESLGVVNYDINRFEGFYYYYYKLFHQIGGTYLLLPIKFEILLLPITLMIGVYHLILFKNKPLVLFFLMILGINVGYLIIGRYNQTAIVFTLFFLMLFWIVFLKTLIPDKVFWIVLLTIALFNGYNSYPMVTVENDAYQDLGEHLQLEGRVLCNLNMDYHLKEGQLIDYRNLWYETDFEAYIKKHDIKYIVIPEELSYIKKTSPKWDILYGPLPYYDSMMRYLETCELIDTFDSKTYGMRIARYINTYPWTINIYKVSD
ncbi:MAG: hypothetical protein JEZ08_22075 [Clostridiales bacterium]|nr:hypothetical protein [Clostridiales bacterium]